MNILFLFFLLYWALELITECKLAAHVLWLIYYFCLDLCVLTSFFVQNKVSRKSCFLITVSFLFAPSFCSIFLLFVIFYDFSSPKIAEMTFMRSLITNWDCHHLKKKNTFSHKANAGIRVWLIMYKCLLANMRPLLTKQERIWGEIILIYLFYLCG